MKQKRPFHNVNYENMFVFHVRNDITPDPEKALKDPMNGTLLNGSMRAITVVVLIDGTDAAYGIGRCEWKYQFNRKLARAVALGRAKQALWNSGLVDQSFNAVWYKQGTAHDFISSDFKSRLSQAKSLARRLIQDVNDRTAAINAKVQVDRMKKSKE